MPRSAMRSTNFHSDAPYRSTDLPPAAVVKPEMAGKSEPVSAAAKAALLERIEHLDLPANFLDEVIDKLGGAGCVAEMTGRKGRIVRIRGRGVYELRAKPESVEMDSLNVKETGEIQRWGASHAVACSTLGTSRLCYRQHAHMRSILSNAFKRFAYRWSCV